ncbi:MAG: hypothetical protein EOP02_34300, partial [Proteobacteria bacterium]
DALAFFDQHAEDLKPGRGLQLYLRTPKAGLWYDKQVTTGTMVQEPAPASSFYHIVCAIVELGRSLNVKS